MGNKTVFRLTAVLVAMALLGAACGDDDDEASSGTGATAATTTPAPIDRLLQGVTATSIKVGGLGTLTSPRLATFQGMDVGAKVVFDKVNAEGGIAGRKIDFIGVLDDAESNDTNTEQARKLVDQEKVFAVVPVVSNVLAGGTVLQNADIPYFGWGFHDAFCDVPEAFSFNGCGNPKIKDHASYGWPGLIAEAIPDAKTVSFTVDDTAAARAGVERYLRALDDLGLESVLNDFGVPAGQGTDFTPYVQKVVAADPDVAFIVAGAGPAIQIAGRLKAAGFKGKITSPAIYDPRVAGAAQVAQAIDGMYAYISFATFEGDNPGIAQMKADVAKYAPAGTLLTQPLASGYLSAQLFVQILKEVGPDLTYKRFYEVAEKTTFDGGGALAPITFPEAHRRSRECGSIAQLKDGKFVEALALTCVKAAPSEKDR